MAGPLQQGLNDYIYALMNQIYGTVPFLMLFQVGFLYTGLLSIFQQFTGEGEMAPEIAK